MAVCVYFLLCLILLGSGQHTNRSGANYSMLSEDKMEVMSQLARRDLKNRALQAQVASALILLAQVASALILVAHVASALVLQAQQPQH